MTDTFPGLDAEHWLIRKLNRPDLFGGITTAVERRERIRNEIIERGLASEHLGQFNGVREQWFMTFERFYGVPLHVEPSTLDLLKELHQPTGETKNG
jgi:hypothetical protein